MDNPKIKTKLFIIIFILSILILPTFIPAVTVESVEVATLYSGDESTLTITLKNNLNDDVEDVSFSLDLKDIPFTAVGASEYSVDKIKEDKTKIFSFRIKASNNAQPGDYSIPYTINYKGLTVQKSGTIGVRISAKTDLGFSAEGENTIIGSKGKITLKIINKGFGEARFVSVKIIPSGYTLISDDTVYIGSVGSDDFETAAFDVIFNSKNTDLTATVDYKDFENNQISSSVNIPITVYTREEAVELGIIKNNKTSLYVFIIIIIIILWYIIRKIRKRRRNKK